MTTTHLDALIAAADLTDRADRLMLADAMRDAGRDEEAELLLTVVDRPGSIDGEPQPVLSREGRVVAATEYVIETSIPGRSHRKVFLATDDDDAMTMAPALCLGSLSEPWLRELVEGTSPATATWFVRKIFGPAGAIGQGTVGVPTQKGE